MTRRGCTCCRGCPCDWDYAGGIHPQFVSTTPLTDFLTYWSTGYPTPNSPSWTDIGLLGTVYRQTGDCTFDFIKMHAFHDGSTYFLVYQYTTFEIVSVGSSDLRLVTESEIRIYRRLPAYGSTVPTAQQIFDDWTSGDGTLQGWYAQPGFTNPSLYAVKVSGSAESDLIERALFDCESFSIGGTYTDPSTGHPWYEDTWTVQSV